MKILPRRSRQIDHAEPGKVERQCVVDPVKGEQLLLAKENEQSVAKLPDFREDKEEDPQKEATVLVMGNR
ncbi:hypothetical protein TYRP_018557 [Tyrophagus putrescentiae]|nr:hypothetical protein TYRP_018557 [Tyrophagus putrescentiae]